ncbi:MAG: isoleucine--tRNA ligase [Candidatus ainarchaeum sp.]|nr:isoleucine--tRNA ligase [Candidatus ainarchaeum sp.]MDD3975826.1 isoleucine--tRNA ligase [Candidatus ainarchaeum sp.]
MFSNQDEKNIKQFWKENNIPKKVREKKSDKKYYFIDGPPYASGRIHTGTAMNRILKDIIIRYKRQKGFEVLDIPGFDCHGVPIEMKVQKKYSLKSKEDIIDFGVENFIKECYAFSTEHIKDMSQDIEYLGQWMDWENPYRTLDKKYIQGAWWTFKKAVDKGLLYHGKYPVHVCSHCETSVSFNEIEYQDLKDISIYVKMQSEEDPNKYYVIWTTTPWTLPANLAIMVNPKYEYIEIINGLEKLVVAKNLSEKLVSEFGLENISFGKTFLGKDLLGKKYKPILGEWIKLEENLKENAYKIISSERFVHLEGGTGLVHCAPGHGREDFQVGQDNNIYPYCPVTISGEYDETIINDSLKNKKVKELDPYIIEYLENKNYILAKAKVKHSYPTCWRCHSPLIQVALPQWFLKTSEMREELLEKSKEISWFPTWGKDRFKDWLNGLSDWPISRARFWGIPLPIWKCDKCGKIHVFGSLEELSKKATKQIDLDMDVHKPYIDQVEIICDCGEIVKRIPEISDVWFDSGVASWASLNYPSETKRFDEFWPPDVNIEGSDQIRGWWNSQLITSVISFGKVPFKHISMHGMVLDGSKRKLSKSEGNDIPLIERFEKLSIDYYRYYFAKAFDGEDIVLDENKFKDIRRIFNLLENVFNFLEIFYNNSFKFTESLLKEDICSLTIEDKWILSRFNNVFKDFDTNFEITYFSKSVCDLEKFVLEDFSRIYIKLLRKRENKNNVLIYIYSQILKLFSPIIPHFTEFMFQKFKENKEVSIHLLKIDNVDQSLISSDIEKNFSLAQEVIVTILALREDEKKRLRWILPRVFICGNNATFLDNYLDIIKDMANIEEILTVNKTPIGNFSQKKINNDLVVYLDKDISKDYENIWELSELVRLIQSERKNKKFNPNDCVSLKIFCSDISFLEINKEKIENLTNSKIEILKNLFEENKQCLIKREFSFSF